MSTERRMFPRNTCPQWDQEPSCPGTVYKGRGFPVHNGLAKRNPVKMQMEGQPKSVGAPEITESKRQPFRASVQIANGLPLFLGPGRQWELFLP